MKTPCSAFALALPLALLPALQEPAADGLGQEQLEALSERIKGQIEELRGQEFLRPVSVSATDRDGFLAYARAADTGLANQGWKDSHDSVFHADGSDARGPVALVEVQGYVCAALRTMAELAARRGQPSNTPAAGRHGPSTFSSPGDRTNRR